MNILSWAKNKVNKLATSIESSIVSGYRRVHRVAERIKSIRYPSGERGVSGTDITYPYINEEENPELADLGTRCDIFDKIVKNIPAARAAFAHYSYPILSAEVSFDINHKLCDKHKIPNAMRDKMVEDVELAFKEQNRRRLKKRLQEHLQFMKYGFSISEMVYENRDGKVWVADLPFRHPRTVLWIPEPATNKLKGIEQRNYYGNKTPEPIPRKDLVIFAQEDIGDNFEGIATTRYMNRSYKCQMKIIVLIMVGFERFLVATPTLEPMDSSRQGYNDALNYVQSIRSHEKGGGVLPFGWKLINNEMNFTGSQVAINFKQELDRDIYLAAMTQQIMLSSGASKNGSNALMDSQSTFFDSALQTSVNIICDGYNYDVIPRQIDFNYTTLVYPEMKMTIKKEDVEKFNRMVHQYLKDGVLPKYPELLDQIIQKNGYPEVDISKILEEQEQKQREQFDRQFELQKMKDQNGDEGADKETDGNIGTGDKADKGKGDEKKPPEKPGKSENPDKSGASDKKPPKKKSEIIEGCKCLSDDDSHLHWRELTELEEKAGGVEAMEEKRRFLDVTQEDFQKQVAPIVKKQLAAVLKVAKSGKPDMVINMEVPFVNDYREAIEEYYRKSAEEGIKAVSRELKRQVPDSLFDKVKLKAKEKAAILSRRLADDLRFQVATQMTDGRNKELDRNFVEERLFNSAFLQMMDAFKEGF